MRLLNRWPVTSQEVLALVLRRVLRPMGPTLLVTWALIASACGVRTDVVMLDPAGPAYAPVPPGSVWIFDTPESVLLDYEPIARMSAGSGMSGALGPDAADVITALQETAGDLGADAIILGEVLGQRPAPIDAETLPARGDATAIRLGDAQWASVDLGRAARRLDGMRTVAVAPLFVGDGGSMPDSISLGFEEDIEYGLGAAGYDVLPSAVYDSIWTEYAFEVGGLFDPITGERDDELLNYVVQRTRQRLIDDHQVDGFVIPEVWTVLAPYSGTVAQWHGTDQSVIEPGAPLPTSLEVAAAVLDVLLCGDEEDPGCEPEDGLGSVAAASLMVRLENSIGASLYTGWGGIEVLELANMDTGETYARRQGYPFGSPRRNQEAVAIALEGLGRGG